MTPAVTIRPYAESDLEGVIAVVHDLQSFEAELFDRMRAPEELGADYVGAVIKEASDANGCLLVAESAGKIVGYCSLMTRRNSADELSEVYYEFAHVGDLGVLASDRSRGIGKLLIDECAKIATQAGIKWLRLNVLADNIRARKFYAAQGFSENLILLERPL